MDSDQGKLFVGGIPWETSEERLKEYFKAYGEVVETVIMKDRATGRSRGFGFVVFADAAVVDRVLQEKHTIDGRTVEAKKAVPRDEQQNAARSNLGAPLPAGQIRTKKIFVGGLASTVTEEAFRKYFAEFGTITDVVVMYDHNTQRPRGFGFITYDSEDAVDKVLQKPFHELNEKMVEVKRAVPKELSAGSDRSAGGGRGAGYGATYGQGFSSSPVGGGYGARPDGRYGPAPAGRGMYPYAAPAYGAGGYGGNAGYGAGMNGGYTGAGYGAGAPYGSATGGPYGSAYTTAPAAGGYGTAAGYGAAATAQMGGRSGWGGGGATGYGPASGSATYGTGAGGYGSGGSWGSAPAGAQPTVSSGGYGYGSSEAGYVSTDAGYGSKSAGYGTGATGYGGTGAAGGGGGNYPGNYGGMYGSAGYGEAAFPTAAGVAGGAASGGYGLGTAGATDGTVNGPSGYGGSYGAAGRQTPKGPDTRFRPYPASGDRSS